MPTRSANFAYIRFAALFLGLTALVVPQISMAALVAHWTGDDTVVDMTGNGHNGTLVGGATYGPGQINNAFALNGTGALVTVPDDVAWTNTLAGDFSISLWANLTEPASGSIINPDSSFVAQDIGGGPQPKWGLLAGGNLVAFHINGLGTGGPFFAQTPYAPARDGTEWTHLTVVRKAEAGGNRYSIYLNSILGASQLDGSFITIPDVAVVLIIG